MPLGPDARPFSFSEVLNDLGLLVLDSEGHVLAASFGGAVASVSLHLKEVKELFIFPLSFRAWPGPLHLRLQGSGAMSVRPRSAPPGLWGRLWTVPGRGLRQAVRHGALLFLRLEGAAFLLMENQSEEAVLARALVEGNFVVTHTARGVQFGDFLERNEELHAAGVVSDWRRYRLEDMLPARSRQLISYHFGISKDWDLEIQQVDVEPAASSGLGQRPMGHPFCPEALDVPRRRWAARRECVVCQEQVAKECCACEACARLWAVEQEAQGLPLDAFRCAGCGKQVDVSRLLPPEAQRRAEARGTWRQPLEWPQELLERLGLKQCPGCGEGVQKESETCHKMICRSCRARFCFKCLARLEYFNCACSGAEHHFVDPVSGEILAHQ